MREAAGCQRSMTGKWREISTVKRGNSLFVSIYNRLLSDDVMQGVTFMMHSAERMGIPGEGPKFPTPAGARK